MIFNLKFIAIAALASYLSGTVSGLYIAHKWYNYSAMSAAIRSLKEANKRYRDAVGVSKDIDKDTSNIEIDNETIMNAINAKIEEALNKKGPPDACRPEPQPTSKPADRNPIDECIPSSVLRAIGELK